jgi:membrane-bound lytic murein transglycosylase A
MLGLVGAACAAPAAEPWRLPDTQLEPATWTEVEGWTADDHHAAFLAFQTSCRPLLKVKHPRDRDPVTQALTQVCRRAAGAGASDARKARAFFETNFQPVRIAGLGESEGFLTGY